MRGAKTGGIHASSLPPRRAGRNGYCPGVLVERRAREGIFDGSVTVLVRRWRRPQATAGHVYRTAAGRIAVDEVTVIDPASLTDADAGSAGYPTADALRYALRGSAGDPVYLLRVRPAEGPDPRALLADNPVLSSADIAELDRRLDRLDHTSETGAWTMSVLAAIRAEPGRRAGDLAKAAGRERLPYKADVRKLKALGLTISLQTGYRLSPRGEAYLHATARR
jgi:hypothetical protein